MPPPLLYLGVLPQTPSQPPSSSGAWLTQPAEPEYNSDTDTATASSLGRSLYDAELEGMTSAQVDEQLKLSGIERGEMVGH